MRENGIYSFEDKIYDNYLIFDNLKKNKIKFFLLYIGDINQNYYEQNLLYNIITNNKLNQNKEKGNVLYSLKNKYKLTEIKSMNKNLKKIISSFKEKVDLITDQNFPK